MRRVKNELREQRSDAQRRLAAQAQRCRADGDVGGERRALTDLLQSVAPMIQELVGEFPLRGSLSREDLLQTAQIGILKYLKTYDPLRGEFAPFAHQVAKREIIETIERRGSEVRVSHWAKQGRGRTAERDSLEVVVVSRDEKPSGSEAPNTLEPSEMLTPEELFGTAEMQSRLHKAIGRLPQAMQLLVQKHFELNGFDYHSMRDLHAQTGIARPKLKAMYDEALARLRKELSR